MLDSPCFSASVAQFVMPKYALGAKFGTDVIFANTGKTWPQNQGYAATKIVFLIAFQYAWHHKTTLDRFSIYLASYIKPTIPPFFKTERLRDMKNYSF